MEYVPIDGIVEPVKVESGQFITGRFELHADYHQRRRGYERRFPSSRTVWRWLVSLRNMQNLTIKSYSKYSIISIINWHTYQENVQRVTNRCPAGDHKQEVNKNEKESCRSKRTDNDSQASLSGREEQKEPPSSESKINPSAKRKRKGAETNPDVITFIQEWNGPFSKKFNEPYMPNWAKEGKLTKDMLRVHGIDKLRELKKAFFSSQDSFIQNSDYSIGAFKANLNKIIVEIAKDPVEQAKREMNEEGEMR
jgi:hypothetical protein